MRAQGPDYYDGRFSRSVTLPVKLERKRYRNSIVSEYVVGSVLDLGCGLGFLADCINEERYLGVDFSSVAIEWARENTSNPNAQFWQYDIYDLPGDVEPFDTVVLCEVLEHVEDPQRIASIALQLAKQRIVVIVPVNMPGGAHVWPVWSCESLGSLFGVLGVCKFFRSDHPKITPSLIGVKTL